MPPVTPRRAALLFTVLLSVPAVVLHSPASARADLLAAPPGAAAAVSYFNWADHASGGFTNVNVHLLNPGALTSTGTVGMPGWSATFTVNAGGEGVLPVPAGVIGGPVTIAVTSGPPVIASQRTTYNQTLSELPALRPTDASSDGWFPWYDLASPGMNIDNLHILNPGAATAEGTVSVGVSGVTPMPFSVDAGGEIHLSFPRGTIGGPVHFQVTKGPPVLVSQRVHYLGGFNELLAARTADAAADLWFPWYDQASPGMATDDVHVLNPGPAPTTGTVSYPGATARTFTLNPGERTALGWPGGIGGPVHVAVTSGNPVLASQRLSRPPGFQEWYGQASAKATTDSWFNWYDNASPGFSDDVHILNPGSVVANASILLPGQTTVAVSIPPGADRPFTYPANTIGGPLRVTSDQPVLASQRSFITPPPTSRVIAVPWNAQWHNLSCESASLQMILAFYGKPYNQNDVMAFSGEDHRPPTSPGLASMRWGDPYVQFVGSVDGSEANYTGYGMKYPPLATAASHFGVPVLQAGEGIAASDLYAGILAGHPAIVWGSYDYRPHSGVNYTAFDGRGIFWGRFFEHVFVVAAVTPDSVGILDPLMNARIIYMPRSQFETQWSQFNNAGIVFT